MTDPTPKTIIVNCGELCQSTICSSNELNLLNRKIDELEPNITIGYDKFVNNPDSLPPRILDLLQIAAHVFCADRLIYRGERDSLGNESWARSFEFHIPVLDHEFWSNEKLHQALNEALTFMTGDRKYSFVFVKSERGHLEKTYKQLSLFNEATEYIDGADSADILLFSGGLDSLAGTIERLRTLPDNNLFLVSHKANNGVTHTQNQIIEYLQKHYANRVISYGFECHNRKMQSREESQRTRMFLFASIAFSICNYANKHSFFVYENGITSINLPIQVDVVNARASRTTHPKTLGLMKKLFRFFDKDFDIVTPYCDKTKEDIFRVFAKYDEKELLTSSVSCSKTRTKPGTHIHCGCCSQCIDRRFAAYAAGLDEYDAEYTDDFIKKIPDNETKQRLYQTLRLASAEKLKTPNEFFKNYPDEIANLIEYWRYDNPEDSLTEIFSIFSRYGDSVIRAAKSIQNKYEDLRNPIEANSLLAMLSSREYLRTPTAVRISEIDFILKRSIPQAFHTDKPKNENDFNDKIQALLTAADQKFLREYPVLVFGISSYRADLSEDGLIIESKYLRGKVLPSKAVEGIAADVTKIPAGVGVMFVVYDPERNIVDDEGFCQSFESKRTSCFVKIYR